MKAELLGEFRRHPSSLTIYMSAYMCEAIGDLTAQGRSSADFYNRFMGWIRPSLAGLATQQEDFSDSP